MTSEKPMPILISPNEKVERLRALRSECYTCTSCELCHNRPPTDDNKKPYVFGAGKVTSRVMFVGQNPGLNEVKEGRPFVGASGKVLNQAFEDAGIDRKSVYITNGVLCYTIDNTTPPEASVSACKKYLIEQINVINPLAVVVMGKSAARSFDFGDRFSVNMCKLNRPWKTAIHDRVYFTVHPAYTIYSRSGFELLVNTFKSVKELI